jgi:hypothetical protein
MRPSGYRALLSLIHLGWRSWRKKRRVNVWIWRRPLSMTALGSGYWRGGVEDTELAE